MWASSSQPRADRRVGAMCSALAPPRPAPTAAAVPAPPVPIAWSLRGPFRLRLMLTEQRQHVEVEVAPPEPLTVTETHNELAEWNPGAAGWTKGDRLHALVAQETTTPGLLHSDSVHVDGPGGGPLVRGVDYEVDDQWGTIGWLQGGSLAACESTQRTVVATYTWTPLRLDSLVLRADNSIELRMGKPYGAAPPLPAISAGERRLMNIWLPGRAAEDGLTAGSLFPVLETTPTLSPARLLSSGAIPRTLAKLRNGQPVSIVAWGDSVTDGGYLPSPADRWQVQLVEEMQARYPNSTITLHTEGWGGRSTSAYLQEPEESPRHFPTAVLSPASDDGVPIPSPDLVISEFVNDASLAPELVKTQYAYLQNVFRASDCDWLILTPHYVRPGPVEGWMGVGFDQVQLLPLSVTCCFVEGTGSLLHIQYYCIRC